MSNRKSNYFCLCNHRKSKHVDYITKTITTYEATPIEKRKHPLEWYLNAIQNDNLKWSCSLLECECSSFKQDNLKYLEERYEERSAKVKETI